MHQGRLFSLASPLVGCHGCDGIAHAPPAPPRAGAAGRSRRRCCRRSCAARGRCSTARSSRRATREALRKLNPVTLWKNPVIFVVEVGAALTTALPRPRHRGRRAGHRVRRADQPLALVHGAVRELRRGDGGGARQGAGRLAAQDEDRGHGASAMLRGGAIEQVPGSALRAGDVVVCERARRHSRRRRGHRRHRDGGRIRHHRRERAGHPRVGRRPQRRDRRHEGALGPDQGPDHVESRRDVPGPHDRAGRRRGAPEDAERDRAEHPDRRPDADLPAGRRHAACRSPPTASASAGAGTVPAGCRAASRCSSA